LCLASIDDLCGPAEEPALDLSPGEWARWQRGLRLLAKAQSLFDDECATEIEVTDGEVELMAFAQEVQGRMEAM